MSYKHPETCKQSDRETCTPKQTERSSYTWVCMFVAVAFPTCRTSPAPGNRICACADSEVYMAEKETTCCSVSPPSPGR